MPFTNQEWDAGTVASNLSTSDYCKVCLIDYNEGEKVQAKCKLPIQHTPDGPYNKRALRNAMGRIFQTEAPADEKKAAARRLVRLAREAGIEVTSSALLRLAGMRES